MNVNVILYDDFNILEGLGIAQVFASAPEYFYVNYYSPKGGLTGSAELKVWTEYLLPEEVEDIVILPGGRGAKRLTLSDAAAIRMIKQAAELSDRCLMIGNGSSILSQTGLLYHRRVAACAGINETDNFVSAGINWLTGIRWVADGKYYSSSSFLSGINMALNVISDVTDLTVAERIAGRIGCQWDPEDDEGIIM